MTLFAASNLGQDCLPMSHKLDTRLMIEVEMIIVIVKQADHANLIASLRYFKITIFF